MFVRNLTTVQKGRIYGTVAFAVIGLLATASAIARPVASLALTEQPYDQAVVVRFSERMSAASLSEKTVTLMGPAGQTPDHVGTSADGKHVDISPQRDLLPGATYTTFVDGADSAQGDRLPMTALTFTTKAAALASAAMAAQIPEPLSGGPLARVITGTQAAQAEFSASCDAAKNSASFAFCRTSGTVDDGIFVPGQSNSQARWRRNKPLPATATVTDWPRNTFARGETALFGVARRIDDKPLTNVTVSLGAQSTRTDAKGRFVLKSVPSGHQTLLVDGSSANHAAEEYGQFLVGVNVAEKKANPVPFTLYVPRISTRDKITIPSPTTTETVISHPAIPGLEIHIPAGTVIRDRQGHVLTELAVVPTPADRSPVPLPDNFPVYFSIEPATAMVDSVTPENADGIH